MHAIETLQRKKPNIQINNISFKVEKMQKNNYSLNCYINNTEAGYIQFEILKTTKGLFLDEETYKTEIIDKLINNNPYIYLAYIVVDDKFRGLGIANKLMNQFDKFWHSKEIDFIVLTACPFQAGKKEGLPLDLLTQFYEKFDFEKLIIEPDNILMFKEK